MREKLSRCVRVALLMACVPIATGCAVTSQPTPPGPPSIPQPPAVAEPPVSGFYLTMLCELQQRVQQVLSSTPATSELCSQPGQ